MNNKTKIFLVGGSVRDKFLNFPVYEKDWIIINGSFKKIKKYKFKQVGKNFPVFLHPKTKEEYAMGRTEKKIGLGYSGFKCKTSKITIKTDLLRRDLTLNSIAENVYGKIINPLNGKEDIKKKVLKHTSKLFREDPLRIIRIARFMSKLNKFKFKIKKTTSILIKKMIKKKKIKHLSKDRIWIEIIKTLKNSNPIKFLETLIKYNVIKIRKNQQNTKKTDTNIDKKVINKITSINNDIKLKFLSIIITKESNLKNDLKKNNNNPIINWLIKIKMPNDFKYMIENINTFNKIYKNILHNNSKNIIKIIEKFQFSKNPKNLEKFITICEINQKNLEKKIKQRTFLTKIYNATNTIILKKKIKKKYNGEKIGKLIKNKKQNITKFIKNKTN